MCHLLILIHCTSSTEMKNSPAKNPANGRVLPRTALTLDHALWDSAGTKRALLRGTVHCASQGAIRTSFLLEEVRGARV